MCVCVCNVVKEAGKVHTVWYGVVWLLLILLPSLSSLCQLPFLRIKPFPFPPLPSPPTSAKLEQRGTRVMKMILQEVMSASGAPPPRTAPPTVHHEGVTDPGVTL